MNRHRSIGPLALSAAAALTFLACGGSESADGSGAGSTPAASAANELTPIELEQGIGPVRDMVLGDIDPAMAAEGETAFVMKCSACHQMADRYVGPRLGTVLARRRPEFVMNMILNANEMVKQHPLVKDLLGQFYTPMPVQVTDPDEARAILEYLRSAQIDSLPDPSATPAGENR